MPPVCEWRRVANGQNVMPKYDHVHVKLTGEDSNTFAILGRVKKALLQGGASRDIADAFVAEATAGDYDHLLKTVAEWVSFNQGQGGK